MPRLRNSRGVVVSVSAETATLLGSQWQAADDPRAKLKQPKATDDTKPAARSRRK